MKILISIVLCAVSCRSVATAIRGVFTPDNTDTNFPSAKMPLIKGSACSAGVSDWEETEVGSGSWDNVSFSQIVFEKGIEDDFDGTLQDPRLEENCLKYYSITERDTDNWSRYFQIQSKNPEPVAYDPDSLSQYIAPGLCSTVCGGRNCIDEGPCDLEVEEVTENVELQLSYGNLDVGTECEGVVNWDMVAVESPNWIGEAVEGGVEFVCGARVSVDGNQSGRNFIVGRYINQPDGQGSGRYNFVMSSEECNRFCGSCSNNLVPVGCAIRVTYVATTTTTTATPTTEASSSSSTSSTSTSSQDDNDSAFTAAGAFVMLSFLLQ